MEVHCAPSSPDNSQEFNEKKNNVHETVREDIESDAGIEKPVWNPGFIARFPVVGASALGVALLCAILAVLVLELSDKKSKSHWIPKLAPNVILSGLNSIAGIALTVAIGNGIAIAWWRQALKGASIEALHASWSFSTSLLSLVLSARYLNVIALTALITKLSIVDNMLLQRATTSTFGVDDIKPTNGLQLTLTTDFPVTGTYTTGGSNQSALLSQIFSHEVASWVQTAGTYYQGGTNCNGYCYLEAPGTGFEFECTEITQSSIDVYNSSQPVSLYDISFQTASAPFNGNGEESSYIIMNQMWSSSIDTVPLTNDTSLSGSQDVSSDCPGTKFTRQCKLYPAIVSYALAITDMTASPADSRQSSNSQSATIALLGYPMSWLEPSYNPETSPTIGYNQTLKQMNGNTPLQRVLIPVNASDSNTQLGGIKTILDMYFSGQASIRNVSEGAGFQVNQTGTAALYSTNFPDNQQCGYAYAAPFYEAVANSSESNGTSSSQTDMISSINSLMFGIALDTVQYSGIFHQTPPPPQNYSGQESKQTIIYQTNPYYQWGAFASMIVCILLTLPSYWGYWQLGRKVTLGPFEIAHAFRSPMTAPSPDDPAAMAKTNSTVDDLIKEVGKKRVQYGQITSGDAKGLLGVAEPEHVSRVHPKIASAREEIEELFHAHTLQHQKTESSKQG